jgi:8-oxo-dGTP pyrophosphatase MutT (NUDIX family)
MTEFDWREERVPAGLPVRQVHGWLADQTGRFLLQDRVHEQKFLLPGGKRDSGDSGWVCTLLRECAEESQVQVVPDTVTYLGHQVVTGDPQVPGPYVQVRLFGIVAAFDPAAPDPDSGQVYRRLMTSASQAAMLLDWGPSGDLQSQAAARAARRIGLPPGELVPDSYA